MNLQMPVTIPAYNNGKQLCINANKVVNHLHKENINDIDSSETNLNQNDIINSN